MAQLINIAGFKYRSTVQDSWSPLALNVDTAAFDALQDDVDVIKAHESFTFRLTGKKIAIYGDSWSIDTYGNLGASYIAQATGVAVHVSAMGSKTLKQIHDNCWDDYFADIYIIEGGLNDVSQGTGATAFTNAIKEWLTDIRTVNPNAEIYFVTPPATKTDNQWQWKFSSEFYRIGYWRLAPFLNYGVINGLKWYDIELISDNVHPTSASVPKIANHIINALNKYGDEETHTREFTALGRSDTQVLHLCDGGNMFFLLQKLRQTATTEHDCTLALGSLDTVFTPTEIGFTNSANGNPAIASYDSMAPNSLVLWCRNVGVGGYIYTGQTLWMPISVDAWSKPFTF